MEPFKNWKSKMSGFRMVRFWILTVLKPAPRFNKLKCLKSQSSSGTFSMKNYAREKNVLVEFGESQPGLPDFYQSDNRLVPMI